MRGSREPLRRDPRETAFSWLSSGEKYTPRLWGSRGHGKTYLWQQWRGKGAM